MDFSFSIPEFTNIDSKKKDKSFKISSGNSLYFIGANGGGKTRLSVEIEKSSPDNVYRISAHRALSLNPEISKITEENALKELEKGNTYVDISAGYGQHSRRYTYKASSILNDFTIVIQSLFADQSKITFDTHKNIKLNPEYKVKKTKFEKLIEIWEKVLPNRELHISGDNIKVSIPGSENLYSASDMSDGERAIFYIIGQTLVAKKNSLIIFDEPELHIHRAIFSVLWDELEAARSDCAFVVISHDLEFVASREGQKYVIQDYTPENGWLIEDVPEDTGFSEELTTLILGSRKPILFVEGDDLSLDKAIYRACYPDWTIIPSGPCENVIHSVATMRKNTKLTRILCSGIVDADDYSDEEKEILENIGVLTLPVSEIENLFLLPDVARTILEGENFSGSELQEKIELLIASIISEVQKPNSIEDVVLRYCRRRIDRTLKKIDLTDADTPEALAQTYSDRTSELDIISISREIRERIEKSIENRDIPKLLANFDNKALLALAAKHLKGMPKKAFESWITRAMRGESTGKLRLAINHYLPAITRQ